MVDPLSALAIVKAGLTAGKQIHNMSKEIAGFFDSVDGAKKAHQKKKNRIFATANEEAMATWTAQQNAIQAEEELRDYITRTKGYTAYQDLLKLRRQIANERREAERQAQVEKQERQELILAIMLFLVITVGCIIGVSFFLNSKGFL